jgi:excisionase family DNA binding protein
MPLPSFTKLPPIPVIKDQGVDPFPAFVAVERLFNTAEAAAYLRVQKRTIGKFIAAKRLKASWVGRSWLIPESALRSFVDVAQVSQ